MNLMTKKKITIEDLAGMVKRGFDQTATKADLEKVQMDLKELEAKVDAGFASTNKSIRVLGGEMAEVHVREKEQRHEERVRALERRVELRSR